MTNSLSLCMIVRNEGEYLFDCLNSVKGIADEIIVVDTGSTDNTIEIARSFGAQLHNFTWIDDFSAARNYSIKFARCDWILWVDADERLLAESIPEMKKLLKSEQKAVIYRVQVRNRMQNDDYQYLSVAHRLFTNHHGISFSGRIHEQISPSAAKLQVNERDSNIILDHLGYGLSVEEMTVKFQRNEKLLLRLVKDEPQNAYAHYTLAQNYGLQENLTLGASHYKTALKLGQLDDQMTASLLNSLGDIYRQMENWNRARKYGKMSVKMFPVQIAGHFLLYKIASATGANKETITRLQKILDNGRILENQPKFLASDISIDSHRIWYTLGNEYLNIGDSENAGRCFSEVDQLCPDKINVLEQLGEIARRKNDLPAMEQHFSRLNDLVPENNSYQNILGLVFIKQKNFKAAIETYENLNNRNPEDVNYSKKLAGLYGIMGDQKKSINILERLNSVSDEK